MDNGFFQLLHYDDAKAKVIKGKGRGYFTQFAMHFAAKIDVGGTTVPGEDTFFYKNETIYLASSAAGYKCEGEFVKVKDAK